MMRGELPMHTAEPNSEPIELDGEQMRMDALAESVFEVYLDTIRGTGLDITPTAPAAVDEAILGRVQSVLGATFLTFFGIAPALRYADVFAQIADFATRFAKDHIFPDGNKRTAVKMSLAILKMRHSSALRPRNGMRTCSRRSRTSPRGSRKTTSSRTATNGRRSRCRSRSSRCAGGMCVRVMRASRRECNELYQWVQSIVTGRGSAEELAVFLREHAVWVG